MLLDNGNNYHYNYTRGVNLLTNYSDESLSVLMHELRSPISTLLGIVEQTKMNMNSKVEIEKSLEKIEGVASYLLSLSNNYLEISKSEKAYGETIEELFYFSEITNYVIGVFDFQFNLKHIDFKKNVMDSNFMLSGDALKIKQILINVLSNAYKYTPRNGCVTLDSKYTQKNNEEVEFVLTVKDNGIGMSQDFLKKVFTPYNCETNHIKPKGTGLGLTIIKDNVKKLMGTIKIDSIKGVGTTIEVTIPLKIVETKYDFRKINFLIVDDCIITQQVIKAHLESVGAKCDIANDGLEGFEKFSNSPNNYYQVIITDNKMKELDGCLLARKIRELKREDIDKLIIIGISASGIQNDIISCITAGMNEYLIKPITKENLLHTISKQIKV